MSCSRLATARRLGIVGWQEPVAPGNAVLAALSYRQRQGVGAWQGFPWHRAALWSRATPK